MLRTGLVLGLALAAEAFTTFNVFPLSGISARRDVSSGLPTHREHVGRYSFSPVAARSAGTRTEALKRPQPGELGASELVTWLWNEAQYLPDYPSCSMPFFADDVVYEDMIYKDPFVGRAAVEKMLLHVKEICPPDFVFVMDRCSDGKKACGFTWHIELKNRPEAGKFANGGSYYELNDEGKICYVRDLVEPTLKLGDLPLRFANLAAKALGGDAGKK